MPVRTRRALPLAALCSQIMLVSSAHAAWLPPVDISEAGQDVGSPHVVLDSAGDATAVWDRWTGNDTVVEAAYRPPGQTWQMPQTISDAPGESSSEGQEGAHDATAPRIAIDAQGDVTAIWERYAGTNRLLLQVAYRPAGGEWQTPITIGEVHTMMSPEPWLAMDEQGDASATWTDGGTVFAAYKPAGEAWGSPVRLSDTEAFVPETAMDARGDVTAVWMHFDGARYVVQSAYRPAGGAWELPVQVSAPGEEGGDPQVALDARGDAIIVWDGHPTEYSDKAMVAYRPSGGTWREPVAVSDEGEMLESLKVALDAEGDAIVAWGGSGKEEGGYAAVRATYRSAGGGWESPRTLSEAGENAYPSDLVFDASGNAAILWQRSSGSKQVLQVDYRPADGDWQAPGNLSTSDANVTGAVLVLDAPGEAVAADGDATAVWTSGNDGECGPAPEPSCVGSYVVQAAGYDALGSPPEELDAPATGTVGAPVEVSTPERDVYSPLLEFGDGASSTTSGDASHTYSNPGTYTVTFSGTEVMGYRSTVRRTIVIEPASSGQSPPAKSQSVQSGERPPATKESRPSATVVDLGLEWLRQSRASILAKGTLRAVCHMSSPGVCTLHGVAGLGKTRLAKGGAKLLAVKLTAAALALLRKHRHVRFIFQLSASVSGGRVPARTVAFALR